jgi:hypothetical protein
MLAFGSIYNAPGDLVLRVGDAEKNVRNPEILGESSVEALENEVLSV